MAKYRVDTDQGSYVVETENGPESVAANAPPVSPGRQPGESRLGYLERKLAANPDRQKQQALIESDREKGRRVLGGLRDIVHGNFAKGGADVLEGIGSMAGPGILAATAPMNPLGTAAGLASGYSAGEAAQYGAEKLGATPDQARLARDLAGVAVGGKVGKMATPAPPSPGVEPPAAATRTSPLPAPGPIARAASRLIPGGRTGLRMYEALREWQAANPDVTPPPRVITADRAARMAKSGSISIDEYKGLLAKARYAPEDIDLMARDLQMDMARPKVGPSGRPVKPPPLRGQNPPPAPEPGPQVAPPPLRGSSLDRQPVPARTRSAAPPPLRGSSLSRMAPEAEGTPTAQASPAPPAAPAAPPFEDAYPVPEEVRTGPPRGTAPKEHYQAGARTVKARALARGLKSNGFTLDDLKMFGPEEWSQAAQAVGVNAPSQTSIEQVFKEFPNIEVNVIPKKPQPLPQFARGGIIRKPTMGLVGEAGPEVITPVEDLESTKSGRSVLNSLPDGLDAPEPPEGVTASNPTVPERPDTIAIQMRQLITGKRRAVMIPRGTETPRVPKGMKLHRDAFNNKFIYDPQYLSEGRIRNAVLKNDLPSILGARKGGMGTADKSKLKPPIKAVTSSTRSGSTIQSAAADRAHMQSALRQAKKITPKGGRIKLENPAKELKRRLA